MPGRADATARLGAGVPGARQAPDGVPRVRDHRSGRARRRARRAVGQRAGRVRRLRGHRLRRPAAAAGQRMLVERAGVGRGRRRLRLERSGALPHRAGGVACGVDHARPVGGSGRAGARKRAGGGRRHHAGADAPGALPAPAVRVSGPAPARDALRHRPRRGGAAPERSARRRRRAVPGLDRLPHADRVQRPRCHGARARGGERARRDRGRRLVQRLRRLPAQACRRALRRAPRAALRAAPGARGRRAGDREQRRLVAGHDRADPLFRPPARRVPRCPPRARGLGRRRLRRQPVAPRDHSRARRRRPRARARAAHPRDRGAAPESVTERAPGTYVFDLGQNMVGWVRLAVRGERGTVVRLRFAEMLEPDGRIYTWRTSAAPGRSTPSSSGAAAPEVFEPRFTFHGFRYVEVSGLAEPARARRPHRARRALRHRRRPGASSAPASWSTGCGATSRGASGATSSPSPPTARSATSGSAGWPTPRCSSRPRR